MQQGKEEGIKEEIKEGLYQAAKSLIGLLKDEVIADKRGITLEEVKALKE